ncbi:MAG: glycosyltransferase family 9 protein [Rubrivivax sp.]
MSEVAGAAVREILVFRSAALGDFILATPALAAVRRQFPGRRIVLLTTTSASKEQRAKVAAYAGNSPALQHSLPWTAMATPHLLDETLVVPDLASRQGLRLARAQLRGRHFECALMLLDPASPWPGRVKKWAMLKWVTGGATVLGWRARGSFNGDRERLRARSLLGHHVHGPMQFLREMKPPRMHDAADIRFDLRPGADAQCWAQDWARTHAIGLRVVAVAPGSIQPHKRWPIERFEALCRSLLDEFGDILLLVIGTPTDRELGQRLAALAPRRILNLAGESSIAQSAALLARCALLVGNDGGAMHLGDAMGARVVSIVPGLEFPDSIEPWHNADRAVRHPVPCAPCYSFSHCPVAHNACMRELPLEPVLHQCRRALTE